MKRVPQSTTANFIALMFGLLMLLNPITARAGQIHDAVDAGDTKKVSQLIQLGDVNAKNDDGRTALMMAGAFGLTEVVELLLAANADVNAKDNGDGTALMTAAILGRHEVAMLLLAAKANVNSKDSYGWTALMYAALYGRTELVKLLLVAKADVIAKNKDGWTALMAAANFGSIEVVKLLLAAKTDVNAVATDGDDKGKSAMLIAKDKGHLDLAILIKQAGGK